jgi:2-polyprenyl-6-methoxyphenol hydroxylase-like FAD-dependent oxidoreductase
MRACWLIGCDGAHSLVRRHLGVPFDGEDHAPDWLMAEVNVDWSHRNDFAHVFARTAAPLPAFPLPSGRWRLFVPEVPDRAGERRPPDVAEIERLAAERGPGRYEARGPDAAGGVPLLPALDRDHAAWADSDRRRRRSRP